MNKYFEQLFSTQRVMPVLVLEAPKTAVAVARALHAGGIGAVEVTLRTATAWDCVQAIQDALPELTVGVGTLTLAKDVERSRVLGVPFGVSPGVSEALLDAADGWPLLPGVATPSEILQVVQRGRNYVKLFPAEVVGGIPALKALAGPFPSLRFCPTGGIKLAQLAQYLAQPNVCCVGGSWLAAAERVQAQDWDGITAIAQETVAIASKAMTLGH